MSSTRQSDISAVNSESNSRSSTPWSVMKVRFNLPPTPVRSTPKRNPRGRSQGILSLIFQYFTFSAVEPRGFISIREVLLRVGQSSSSHDCRSTGQASSRLFTRASGHPPAGSWNGIGASIREREWEHRDYQVRVAPTLERTPGSRKPETALARIAAWPLAVAGEPWRSQRPRRMSW